MPRAGARRGKSLPKGFAPRDGPGSKTGEFEKREFREIPRKQGPETRTGRRFEASACWYNPRVKLSLMPLIQLREPDSNRRPRGYEPRELPGCSIPRSILFSRTAKIDVVTRWKTTSQLSRILGPEHRRIIGRTPPNLNGQFHFVQGHVVFFRANPNAAMEISDQLNCGPGPQLVGRAQINFGKKWGWANCVGPPGLSILVVATNRWLAPPAVVVASPSGFR